MHWYIQELHTATQDNQLWHVSNHVWHRGLQEGSLDLALSNQWNMEAGPHLGCQFVQRWVRSCLQVNCEALQGASHLQTRQPTCSRKHVYLGLV
jgi:hypothetical protein